MQIDVRHGPAYALAYCHLRAGEVLRAETGSMVAMSGGVKVTVDAGPGGVTRGLMRKALVREGLFMTKYEAVAHGAWVSVAPRFPGDIVAVDPAADPRGIVAEAGSVLALEDGVSANPRWAGLSMVAMREGATMIHLSGAGTAVLAAYGGIEAFDLGPDDTMILDTGHVVAYTAGMHVEVGPLTSIITSALSGEGLVARIHGPGRVWSQTRSIIDLGRWLFPKKVPAG
jgi:uncharacterized protein (TIGR00266 family)